MPSTPDDWWPTSAGGLYHGLAPRNIDFFRVRALVNVRALVRLCVPSSGLILPLIGLQARTYLAHSSGGLRFGFPVPAWSSPSLPSFGRASLARVEKAPMTI